MSYCSFFDLDETILNCKSMIETLKYFYRMSATSITVGEQNFRAFLQYLNDYQVQKNASRSEMNRLFYRNFCDFKVDKMRLLANEWFEHYGKHSFNSIILKEIKKHQRNSAIVVIVSGSFEDCIHPIAEYLGISEIVCTKLKINRGLYTGQIDGAPTIGEGKAKGIMQFIGSRSLSLSGSYAYGDHISDLNMLSLVEHPVIVGSNKALYQYGKSRQWKHLSGGANNTTTTLNIK